MITVENLTFAYKNKPVLENISFKIPKNKITTIIGPNGCGKSTLMKLITRTLKLQSGDILLKNRPIWKYRQTEFAKMVAYLPQSNHVPMSISVEELVLRGRTPYLNWFGNLKTRDYEIANRSMQELGVYSYREKPLKSLSGGERKKVWIAMTMARQAPILVLDEPTNSLDLQAILEFMKLLKKQCKQRHTTIIMVLHDINLASRYSDELIVLKQGKKVAKGSPYEVVKPELIKQVYNISAKVKQEAQTPFMIPYV